VNYKIEYKEDSMYPAKIQTGGLLRSQITHIAVSSAAHKHGASIGQTDGGRRPKSQGTNKLKRSSSLGIPVAGSRSPGKACCEWLIRLQEWLVAGDASLVEPNLWTQEVSSNGSSSHSIDSPRCDSGE